jgi:hypothetical protein
MNPIPYEPREVEETGTLKGRTNCLDHVLLIIAMIIVIMVACILLIIFHLQMEGKFIGGHPSVTEEPHYQKHASSY